MRKSIQHRLTACACMAALVIVQGCASSKNLRAQYGTLGVASADLEPGVLFTVYDASSSTGGTGVNPKTYGDILRGGASSGNAAILLVPVFLAVVGVVDLGMRAANSVGTSATAPVPDPAREKAVDEIKASFQQFVAEHDPNASIRQRVVALAKADAQEKTIDAGAVGNPGPDGRQNYSQFASFGAQTILKITSFNVEFKVASGKDPVLSLSFYATARLSRFADDQTIWYTYPSTSPSTEHKYSKLMANDAALLKSIWNKKLDELAQQINRELATLTWQREE
jgi:hypothetical protein